MTIRVGLIGFGYAGRTFHAPLIGGVNGLDLVAVASSRPADVRDRLGDVAVVDDPVELCRARDVDLVVIAAPNATHAPLAAAALRHGKHVVIDKPFTITLREARALAAQSHASDRLLSVFHNRRWDSDYLSVRREIEAGTIGPISCFESHFDRFRPQVRDRWREHRGPGGGLWFDLGPHLVDQALLLMGLPDDVQADLATQREGAVADDWAHAVLRFGEGRAILHASLLATGARRRFVVHGRSGSLLKRCGDEQENQLLTGMTPGEEGWGADADPLIVVGEDGEERRIRAADGDQRRYYAGIADAIAGAAPNPVPPVQAIAVMAVLEAASTSDRTGQRVAPDLTEAERAAWHESLIAGASPTS